MIDETIRNAGLQDIANLLESQRARAVDVVASSAAIRSERGTIQVDGVGDAVLTEDGVTTTSGLFVPNSVAVDGIASSLGIPTAYARKMHENRPDLFDANVNGWLHGDGTGGADRRKFLVRCLRDADGTPTGTMRAWLSNKYKVIDNYDVLMASLQGLREATDQQVVVNADLTERRMYIHVTVPSIEATARGLLRRYRAPGGDLGRDNPGIVAGLVITNSEVGLGAFNVTPRMMVLVCTNGLVMQKDALRKIHAGSSLDEGVINWSTETMEHTLKLIKSQTADAVRTFLSREYVESKIAELEASSEVKVEDPQATVQRVAKTVGFTKDQAAGILSSFIDGADMTSGGVLHAITAYAQTQDGDTAHDMEMQAVPAMLAAAAVR